MAGVIALSLFVSTLVPLCVVAAPKTLGLKFDVKRHQPESPTVTKRAQIVGGALSNEKVRYLMNITVGTPPQYLEIKLDTGSSDMWIPSANSKMCQEFAEECLEHGSYNASLSWTNKGFIDEFAIRYGDCTGVMGNFTTDTVGIFGVSMDDVQMGLAFDGFEKADQRQARGILGVGFESGESATNNYPNIVSQLVLNSHINSRAYSIWLDDYNAATGNILFGGVDTTKYYGELIGLPIVKTGPSDNDMKSTTIQMTSLTFEDRSGLTDLFPEGTIFRVLVDTGGTLSLLPQSVAHAMYSAADVVIVDGEPLVSCDLTTLTSNFTFGFGGPDGAKIIIPLREFVVPAMSGGLAFPDGTPACHFGVEVSSWPTAGILGDTFLRSVYAVFDLDNKQIALAQSRTDADVSLPAQILEITNGTGGIPGVSRSVTVIPGPSSFLVEKNHTLEENTAVCS
ncbi:MAG: hypothetical protein Q9198_004111 [Flavoplaca austrocitrina]